MGKTPKLGGGGVSPEAANESYVIPTSTSSSKIISSPSPLNGLSFLQNAVRQMGAAEQEQGPPDSESEEEADTFAPMMPQRRERSSELLVGNIDTTTGGR